MNQPSTSSSWRSTLAWLAAVVVLSLTCAALTSIEASVGAAVASGAVTGSVTLSLWYAWHREQPHSPSPISEYVVVTYMVAWYVVLAFAWPYAGDNWADWMLILPPVAWIPLASKVVVTALTGHQPGERTMAWLHRLAAVVYFLVVAFLVATLIAIVVSPIPLTAAVLHLVATRFYSSRFTRIPAGDVPSD